MAVNPVLDDRGLQERLALMRAPEERPNSDIINGGVVRFRLGDPHYRDYSLFYTAHRDGRLEIGNFEGLFIRVKEALRQSFPDSLPEPYRRLLPLGWVIREGITRFPPTRFERALEAIRELGRQLQEAAENFWHQGRRVGEVLVSVASST